MKTKVNVSTRQRWLLTRRAFRIWRRLKGGKLAQAAINRISRWAKNALDVFAVYERKFAEWKKPRLTEEEIAEMQAWQSEKVSRSFGRRSGASEITDDNINSPALLDFFHTWAAKLAVPLLEQGDIASVANVGARVDSVCSYLAPKFPDVKFMSVDFQPDLEQHNSLLPQSPNWTFVSGYALELFERKAIQPELLIAASAATLFTNPELRAYCAAMAPITKYVIFSGGWYHMPQARYRFGLVKPEDIDPHYSIPAGPVGEYHHNYPAILAEYGFETVHSEIVGTSRNYYIANVVAKNTALTE